MQPKRRSSIRHFIASKINNLRKGLDLFSLRPTWFQTNQNTLTGLSGEYWVGAAYWYRQKG